MVKEREAKRDKEMAQKLEEMDKDIAKLKLISGLRVVGAVARSLKAGKIEE